MADVFDIFQFNRENIIRWIKDFILFFRSPRKYVTELSIRSGTELLPQFLFYFLAYCASFLFLSTDSLGALWKPAILSLASTLWTIVLFCFTTWIALKKPYIKELLIFILSLSFFANSIGAIIFSYFLNGEDYTYRLLYNTWMGLLLLVLYFGFPFIIQANGKKGIKLLAINYLIINLFSLAFERISFDKYTNITTAEHTDPIYNEYIDLVAPLKQKEKIPIQRVYTVAYQNVTTEFVLQDIVNETRATANTEANKVYRDEISSYLIYLDKQEGKLKFTRNIKIAKLWRQYYKDIATQINFKIKDENELAKIEDLKLVTSDSLGRIKIYLSPIKFVDSVFALQYQLKDYHNGIVRNSTISDIPTNISYLCTNFFNLLADQGLYLLLDEGRGKPYKEKFNAPKEDWF